MARPELREARPDDGAALDAQQSARDLVHVLYDAAAVDDDEPVLDALDHRLQLRPCLEHGVDVRALFGRRGSLFRASWHAAIDPAAG